MISKISFSINTSYREKKIVEDAVIFLLVATGIILATIQFFFNRSLWNDEASLALNIIQKNSFDLLKPLDYQQVAPILFIQFEKLFTTILPNSEYGLRLFPLICYCTTLFIFSKLLKICLKNKISVIFALSIFVLNLTILYYSSEVKQYMSDVLVIVTNYFFLLKTYKNENDRLVTISTIGIVSILLSHVAPMILFTIGLYLVYDFLFIKKRSITPLLKTFLLWFLFFSIYYINLIHKHPGRDYMITFWSKLGTFMTLNPFDSAFYEFFIKFFKYLFQTLLPFSVAGAIVLPLLLLSGLVLKIKRKEYGFAILTVVPVVMHLILSSFQMYPVSPRLILYFTPLLILLISSGFDLFLDILKNKVSTNYLQFSVIIILLFTVFNFTGKDFPIRKREIKKSIDYIQQNFRNGDNLFVDRSADRAFRYYEKIGYFKSELPVTYGFVKNFIKSKEKFPGKESVWILTVGPKQINYNNENDIVGKTGIKFKEVFKTKGSNVYLFKSRKNLKKNKDDKKN